MPPRLHSAPRISSRSRLVALTTLVALGLTGAPALSTAANAAPTSDPSSSRQGEYLAFVSDRTGNDEIYLSRPDGTEVEQLTDSPGFDRAPSWSASGTTLVFNSRREPHTDRPQIYELDIKTGTQQRLTDSTLEEHRASFDETSNTVYFHRGRMFETAFELWAKDLTTGTERQLTFSDNSAIWNAAPTVSPDGSQVLFQSNRAEVNPSGPFPQKLHLLDLATGDIQAIPTPAELPDDVSYDGARWNREGTAIVFSAGTDEGSVLYIAEIDSSGAWQSRAITAPELEASAPAWSPDGTRIAFQGHNHEDEDLNEIRILSLADGSITTVGEGRTPVWTNVAHTPDPVEVVVTISGFQTEYLEGETLRAQAGHSPDSVEGNWQWLMKRNGDSDFSPLPGQTTAMLLLERLTLAEHGAQVIAQLRDNLGNTIATSETATITVTQNATTSPGDNSAGSTPTSPESTGNESASDPSTQVPKASLAHTGTSGANLLNWIASSVAIMLLGAALLGASLRRQHGRMRTR